MVRTEYPHLIDPALIEQAATLACDAKPLELRRLRQTQSRVTYELVLPGDKRAFLKAETRAPGQGWSIALEAWSLEKAAALGIPAPQPLALDCSETNVPFRWLLLSAVSGIHLTDAALASSGEAGVLRQCGAMLTKLHQLQTEGFGPLDDDLYLDEGTVSGTHLTWRSYLLDRARAFAASLIELGLLTEKDAASCLADIAARVPHLTQGHLIHGDFDRGHVFVNPTTGGLCGIIDFGARKSADAGWELSWPSIFDRSDAAAAVIEGYTQAGGSVDQDVLDCYILVRLLWLARYRYERGQSVEALAARDRILSRKLS
jgi:aminoglycoside phosphotransferase (APT) family kinase protein